MDAAEKELAKEKQKHNLIKEQAQKMQNQAAAHEKQAVEQARPPPSCSAVDRTDRTVGYEREARQHS